MADAAQPNTDADTTVLSQGAESNQQAVDTDAGTLLAGGQDDTTAAGTEDTTDTGTEGADDAAEKPVEYEPFTTPEGMALNQGMVDAFVPVAQELGLNQEQAQKLVSLYADQLSQSEAIAAKSAADQRAAWRAEIKGQANWQETATYARRAIELMGDADVSKFFLGSWLGDHPQVIKALAFFGRKMAEDQPGGVPKTGAPPAGPDISTLFYPNMQPK